MLELADPAVRRITRALRQGAGRERVRAAPRLYATVPASIAAVAPRLDHAAQLWLARYTLWSVHALDDMLDDPDRTPAELADVATLVRTITAGLCPPDPRDHFAVELSAFVAAVRARDSGGLIADRFVASLRDAVEAGVAITTLSARVRAGEAEPPDMGEYVAVAARDLNYKSFAYALLAFVGDDPAPCALDLWDQALSAGAVALRLANDRPSVDRDRAAGRLNVLDLRTGMGTPVTDALVDAQIRYHARHHDALLARTCDRTLHASVEALRTCLAQSLNLYRVGDLR
ncbi:hypothetical protein Lfu02_35650 [Longispora fulva]|uniref:Uncharacterized protein n=1 Tax=Longispora fulva TaxID=619741 RepID=A0A8J7GQP8_9ACTN|nr:hypothetical protein [Longispora fulva]MBG6141652.1 hypothetical protein [Longispora fulva]GIG59193.1 hypothetical protein Lfu02_35650 [Longispora fulva]